MSLEGFKSDAPTRSADPETLHCGAYRRRDQAPSDILQFRFFFRRNGQMEAADRRRCEIFISFEKINTGGFRKNDNPNEKGNDLIEYGFSERLPNV